MRRIECEVNIAKAEQQVVTVEMQSELKELRKGSPMEAELRRDEVSICV